MPTQFEVCANFVFGVQFYYTIKSKWIGDDASLIYFSVRTKHFPGDDCSIRNPLERDKEIRELLGIDKKRIDKKHNEETVGVSPKNYFIIKLLNVDKEVFFVYIYLCFVIWQERSTNNAITNRCILHSSRWYLIFYYYSIRVDYFDRNKMNERIMSTVIRELENLVAL